MGIYFYFLKSKPVVFQDDLAVRSSFSASFLGLRK